MYYACGGCTKGILFKDLVSSLVVLTKGTVEEKIRCKNSRQLSFDLLSVHEFNDCVFLAVMYSFYAKDNNCLVREDFSRTLQELENSPVAEFMLNSLFESVRTYFTIC